MSEPQPSAEACVCRACMVQGDDMDSLCDARIKKKLIFCTGLQIAESDGLPAHICHPCRALLNLAHRFKSTCLKSDAALRKTVSIKLEQETDSLDSIRDADWTFDDKCGVKTEPVDGPKKRLKRKIKKEVDFTMKLSVKKEVKATKEKRSVRKKKVKDKMYVEIEVGNEEVLGEDLRVKTEPEVAFDTPDIKPREERPAAKRKRPLWCSICEIKFPDKKAEKEHNTANHSWSCVCEFCGKFFKDRASSYYHIQAHQPSTYPCDQCSYSTGYKHDLVKHKRTHTDSKRYQCDLCPTAYHNSSNLRRHVQRAHEGRRDHVCPVCAHTFFEKRKMLRHLDTHNNIKRFKCGECGAALSRRTHYMRHMMRQHGIRVEKLRPGPQKTQCGSETLMTSDNAAPPLPKVLRNDVTPVGFALEAPFAVDSSRYTRSVNATSSGLTKGDRSFGIGSLSKYVDDDNGGTMTPSKVNVGKDSGNESPPKDIAVDCGFKSGVNLI